MQRTFLSAVWLMLISSQPLVAQEVISPIHGRDITVVPSVDKATLDVALRIEVWRAGAWQSVSMNETLHSGVHFQMFLTTTHPGYIYLIHQLSSGKYKLLFPETGERYVDAGTQLRLPAPGQDYKLNQTPGEEHIYLVASRHPLHTTDMDLEKLIRELRDEESLPEPGEPVPRTTPVKEPAGEKSRESYKNSGTPGVRSDLIQRHRIAMLKDREIITVPSVDGTETLRTAEREVAVMHFQIHHAP